MLTDIWFNIHCKIHIRRKGAIRHLPHTQAQRCLWLAGAAVKNRRDSMLFFPPRDHGQLMSWQILHTLLSSGKERLKFWHLFGYLSYKQVASWNHDPAETKLYAHFLGSIWSSTLISRLSERYRTTTCKERLLLTQVLMLREMQLTKHNTASSFRLANRYKDVVKSSKSWGLSLVRKITALSWTLRTPSIKTPPWIWSCMQVYVQAALCCCCFRNNNILERVPGHEPYVNKVGSAKSENSTGEDLTPHVFCSLHGDSYQVRWHSSRQRVAKTRFKKKKNRGNRSLHLWRKLDDVNHFKTFERIQFIWSVFL